MGSTTSLSVVAIDLIEDTEIIATRTSLKVTATLRSGKGVQEENGQSSVRTSDRYQLAPPV